jgi:hypothetical protein
MHVRIIYVCICTYALCMYVWRQGTHVCVCVCMYVCECMCVCVCVTHAYLPTYIHTKTHTYIHRKLSDDAKRRSSTATHTRETLQQSATEVTKRLDALKNALKMAEETQKVREEWRQKVTNEEARCRKTVRHITVEVCVCIYECYVYVFSIVKLLCRRLFVCVCMYVCVYIYTSS